MPVCVPLYYLAYGDRRCVGIQRTARQHRPDLLLAEINSRNLLVWLIIHLKPNCSDRFELKKNQNKGASILGVPLLVKTIWDCKKVIGYSLLTHAVNMDSSLWIAEHKEFSIRAQGYGGGERRESAQRFYEHPGRHFPYVE